MRRRYLWPSLVVAAWTALVATLGGWLDWSEDAIFALAMLMVPVVVVIVGLRVGAHGQHHRPRAGRAAGS